MVELVPEIGIVRVVPGRVVDLLGLGHGYARAFGAPEAVQRTMLKVGALIAMRLAAASVRASVGDAVPERRQGCDGARALGDELR
jgi:ABC-type cobalamin transport system permease subunit